MPSQQMFQVAGDRAAWVATAVQVGSVLGGDAAGGPGHLPRVNGVSLSSFVANVREQASSALPA